MPPLVARSIRVFTGALRVCIGAAFICPTAAAAELPADIPPQLQQLDHGRLLLVSDAVLFSDPARDAAAVTAALRGLVRPQKPARVDE